MQDSAFRSLLKVAAQLPSSAEANFRDEVTQCCDRAGINVEDGWAAFRGEVQRRKSPTDQPATTQVEANISQGDILGDEFPVLSNAIGISSKTLVTKPREIGARYGLDALLEKVVQVERLREVRAFRGFQRRKPSEDNPVIPPSLGDAVPTWLPAIEVVGEGIFIEFKRSALSSWLQQNHEPIKVFAAAQVNSASTLGLDNRMGFEANPAFVMVHTFAHLLINQLSFDCGYSSTSLRERIYCGPDEDPYAGILIYTADSDSEGSMGGLVELGNPARFAEVAYRAVSRSEWCSADPVCRELDAQGIDGLNRAACHACSLVAETSCTFSNILLNRILVSGNGQQNGRGAREPLGYFRSLLDDPN